MSRKKKARKKPVSPKAADPSALAERIRRKIAAGKSQTALKEAKILAREHPGPLAEEVLFEAYRARVWDLDGRGKAREAQELLAHARSAFPGREKDWAALVQELAWRGGDVRSLLRQWAAPGLSREERDALAGRLEKYILDPGALPRAGILPEGDPLLQAARAVSRALEEAASGSLSKSAREGLRLVGRRSPLAPWRSFVLALDAFYREADGEALSHLERIPPDAAPAPLGKILRFLLGETQERPPGLPAVEELLSKVTSWDPFYRNKTRRLERLVSRGGDDKTFLVYRDLCKALGRENPELGLRFLDWMLRGEAKDVFIYYQGQFKVPALKFLPRREVHLLFSNSSMGDEIETYLYRLKWLAGEDGNQPFPVSSDQDLAVIMERSAPLAGEFQEQVTKHWLFWFKGPPKIDPYDPEPGLEKYLDRDAEEAFAVARVFTLQKALFLRLAEKTGWKWVSKDWEEIFRLFAFALHPKEERFRENLEEARRTGLRKEILPVLEKWRLFFPESVDPWLESARNELERSAFKKAAAFLEKARALDPRDERVKEIHFKILLHRVERHLRNQKPHLLRADLEEMEEAFGLETGPRRIYLGAARCLLGKLEGREIEKELEDLARVAGGRVEAVEAFTLAKVLSWPEGRNVKVRAAGESTAESSASLLRLLRLARSWTAEPFYLVEPSSRDEFPTPAELPDGEDDLLLLCEFAENKNLYDLLFAAAGKGLLHSGPLLPRFLMYRLLALIRSCGRCPAWRELEEAVRFFHRKLPDQEVGALLGDWEDKKRGAPLSSEKAEAVLKEERRLQVTLDERIRLEKERGRIPKALVRRHRPVIIRFTGERGDL